LGTVSTDASGNGHAKFTGVTAAAGDALTVGDLTGTLAQVKFTATLTGAATSVSGSSSYNSVKNSLHVAISGATASTTYNVSINGAVVGQITTNSNGHGRLKVTPTGVTIAAGSTISITDTAGSTAIPDRNVCLKGTFVLRRPVAAVFSLHKSVGRRLRLQLVERPIMTFITSEETHMFRIRRGARRDGGSAGRRHPGHGPIADRNPGQTRPRAKRARPGRQRRRC